MTDESFHHTSSTTSYCRVSTENDISREKPEPHTDQVGGSRRRLLAIGPLDSFCRHDEVVFPLLRMQHRQDSSFLFPDSRLHASTFLSGTDSSDRTKKICSSTVLFLLYEGKCMQEERLPDLKEFDVTRAEPVV
jgi:hypothetical protein